MQAVINAEIIAPLVHLLQTAEFDIKKEAAWAISNATSGGTHDQIKYVFAVHWWYLTAQVIYIYVLTWFIFLWMKGSL